ncbi:unnamed protein product [Notodromas monacha]|uniref:acid phosphatase n=1 Tax=Notodromas monacha TaxID=399045 RepID=A0A7R9GID7_9CRUS|nr:unnamed protein product [Notodromas monacha]CAG0922337.1 unnamed protein product [Notodromas monacha]
MVRTSNFFFIFGLSWLVGTTFGALDEEGELLFLQLLYRHGERTPVGFYPNDPYKSMDHWPVRPGQLLNAGKWRHYELGQWLRQRYDGFIGAEYDPAQIHIQSSNVDRTLMSAQCNLLGLFPPVGTDRWNPNLMWQPIPVHTRPADEDLFLRSDAACPTADAELLQVRNSAAVQKVRNENEDLLEYLKLHSGDETHDVIALSDQIYDTLFIEEGNNFTLPNWTKSVYPEKLRPLAAFSFSIITLSPTLRKFRGGPLVALMVENMKKKIGRGEGVGFDLRELATFDSSFRELRKVEVFSAHDITIAMFLGALDLFPPQLPSYASTVMVELRRGNVTEAGGDPYFVKMIIRNSTGVHVLKLPGCEELCPLVEFDRLTKTVQISEERWKKECVLEMSLEITRDAFFGAYH